MSGKKTAEMSKWDMRALSLQKMVMKTSVTHSEPSDETAYLGGGSNDIPGRGSELSLGSSLGPSVLSGPDLGQVGDLLHPS